MKIYALSGLGADSRVFQKLAINCEIIPINWIEPRSKESIENYALRLSSIIKTDEAFGILGVSFGGLVAVEMSKILLPQITILISSLETRHELKIVYRLFAKLKLVRLLPEKLFDPPRWIANFFFGAKDKKLLKQILDDTDLKFAKWAVNELVNWRNDKKLENALLKIEGEKDKLIPASRFGNFKLIKDGGHFMIVDKAKEISKIINEEVCVS